MESCDPSSDSNIPNENQNTKTGDPSSKTDPNCLSDEAKKEAERLARKAAMKCLYCGSRETLHWRDRRIICNECILKYDIGRHVPERPPQVAKKKCLRCGVTYTSQWRDGPLGPTTLCNGCGLRYLRTGNALVSEHCPKTTPSFLPGLHSNQSQNPGKL